MQRKVGMRRVYEEDLVDGVVIPDFIFHQLTLRLPANLREGLLAVFEQNDGPGLVRIERTAWALLCWLNR